LQVAPSGHGVQPEPLPPQSTADSRPLSTWSLQLGDVQNEFAHSLLVQSVPATQALFGPHGPHEPPQSVSVSGPFFLPSLHEITSLQIPPTQLADKQSPLAAHLPPTLHGSHAAPPQSTSVSVPFFWPSLHLGNGG
jgi:hypothetical protein